MRRVGTPACNALSGLLTFLDPSRDFAACGDRSATSAADMVHIATSSHAAVRVLAIGTGRSTGGAEDPCNQEAFGQVVIDLYRFAAPAALGAPDAAMASRRGLMSV
jgi:hypothetical protein